MRKGDSATCGCPGGAGSTDVLVNGRKAIRILLDTAGAAIAGPGAPSVLVNDRGGHRKPRI